MKEKIKKFLENGRGALFALFILELVLTMFVTPNKYDDKTFLDSVTGTTIFSYVGPRYFNWTSRFLIEYALCGSLKISKYFWILVQALMVTLAGYSISKIFVNDNKTDNNIMLLFMILIYPLNVMNSAGWAATTVNYMWPLATCLYSLVPIKKIWSKEKIKIIEYPLYILALIFAGNQEQSCCILVGCYILFTIFMIIRNKKIHPFMVIQTVLSIASLIFILTCPGNYIRNSIEINENFKDFGMLTFLDKFALGFTSTVGLIIKNGNLVFCLLSLIIVVYIFSCYKNKLYRIVAVIPLMSLLILNYFRSITNTIFPFSGELRSIVADEKVMITAANSNNLINLIPIIFSFAIIICLIMSILLIFKNLKNNIAILVFLVGLSSRLIMGFSPTVFVSGERTMIFFDFAMIIVSLLIWQELQKKNDKLDKKVQNRVEILIKLLGTLQYINVLFCILLTQK
ncbi:MAG: DUF6056 family protein [Bacilli bacterium]|nr:DUF6056 family protein [Bacilli bacterium]